MKGANGRVERIAGRLFSAARLDMSLLTPEYSESTSKTEWKNSLSAALDYDLDSFERVNVLQAWNFDGMFLEMDYRCTLDGLPDDFAKLKHFFSIIFFVDDDGSTYFRFVCPPVKYYKDIPVNEIAVRYGTVENAFVEISREVISLLNKRMAEPNAQTEGNPENESVNVKDDGLGKSNAQTEENPENESGNLKNGGWGEPFMSWSGGSIRPNLKKLDKDGYAREFWFDTYLEYDQHWSSGYDERKIVECLKQWATMGKRTGDWIAFTAKSKEDIGKIRDFCERKARLALDVPE